MAVSRCVGSKSALEGDKRTYQMDPANRLEGPMSGLDIQKELIW